MQADSRRGECKLLSFDKEMGGEVGDIRANERRGWDAGAGMGVAGCRRLDPMRAMAAPDWTIPSSVDHAGHTIHIGN